MQANEGAIELTIPADSKLLRLVRLVASGLASTAGFDIDELDDLRIAVDEAVTALLEGGDGSRIALQFTVEDRMVVMSSATPTGSGDPLDANRLEISTQILGAVCDEHDLDVVDGELRVRICRRAAARAA